MMKSMIAGLALAFAVSSAPAFAKDVPAPHSIVIVACKVTDMTGQPGRHGVDEAGNYHEEQAAKDWRDLELFVNKNQEYECKRQQMDLEDSALFGDKAPADLIQLTPNFADWGFCAHVGMMQAADYNREHPGWGVVAIGCPTRVINEQTGETIAWQLPSCPTYLPGTTSRMRCAFSDSVI